MPFEEWWAVFNPMGQYVPWQKPLAQRVWEQAVAAERERCAEVAEETEIAGAWCGGEDGSYWESDASRTREAIARRIREG